MLRQMTEADIPFVVDLLREMHAQAVNYRALEYSPDRVGEVCRQVIETGYAVVYEVDGKIVGVMGGLVYQPAFSRDLMAADMVLYFRPDNRGIAPIRTVVDYIRWAKSMGVKIISVGVTAGVDDSHAVRFYEDMGFRQSGYQLKMEVR